MDDYLKVAERLLFHRPDDVAIARELAQLYVERNDAKRALAKLQICFKADPKDTCRRSRCSREAFHKLGSDAQDGQRLSGDRRIHHGDEQRRRRTRASVQAHPRARAGRRRGASGARWLRPVGEARSARGSRGAVERRGRWRASGGSEGRGDGAAPCGCRACDQAPDGDPSAATRLVSRDRAARIRERCGARAGSPERGRSPARHRRRGRRDFRCAGVGRTGARDGRERFGATPVEAAGIRTRRRDGGRTGRASPDGVRRLRALRPEAEDPRPARAGRRARSDSRRSPRAPERVVSRSGPHGRRDRATARARGAASVRNARSSRISTSSRSSCSIRRIRKRVR